MKKKLDNECPTRFLRDKNLNYYFPPNRVPNDQTVLYT